MDPTLRLHPGVVVRSEGGARFAMHTEQGTVVELNESAALLIESLRGGASRAELVKALQERYPDVAPEEASRDVDELVDALFRVAFLAR